MKQVAVCLVLCVVFAFGLEEDKRLVYGNDDRTEPYAITDSNLENLIQADVAVFFASQFTQNNDGTYDLVLYDTFTTGDCSTSTTLCTDEPFRGQVLAPFCSGFLVADNKIATAGHCLDGNTPDQVLVVFDFYQQSSVSGPVMTNIPKDNVYQPSDFNFVRTNYEDWGIMTLDRTVSGRTPLNYRTSGAPTVGTPLILVGHPWGLPMKVAPNAAVKEYPSDSTSKFFYANTDSYAGNSGSMVVNADTYEVEGILIFGNADFAYDSGNGCCRSNVCSDTTGCTGTSTNFEGITKITLVPVNSSALIQPALLLIALLVLALF